MYLCLGTDACGGQIGSWTPGAVWVLGTKLRPSAGAVHSALLAPSQPLMVSLSVVKPLSHLGLPRKQLQELSGQHQQELAAQLAQFKVEMAEREERQQQVAQDYELRCWSCGSSFHG